MGVGSDMDFGPCSSTLCSILKKEVGKLAETGILKIVTVIVLALGQICDVRKHSLDGNLNITAYFFLLIMQPYVSLL